MTSYERRRMRRVGKLLTFVFLVLLCAAPSWWRQPAGRGGRLAMLVAVAVCPTMSARSGHAMTIAETARILDKAAFRLGLDTVLAGGRCRTRRRSA